MIIPWRVDVPRERIPFMNWLIILITVVVFGMQVNDAVQYRQEMESRARARRYVEPRQTPADPVQDHQSLPADPNALHRSITYRFALHDWSLKGLFGHIWLHGGLMHLLGNMWFLLVFGNAVCAKVGNIAYLFLYIVLGVAAGITQLLVASTGAIGASGAINGIVGMYLVLFPQNEITCYWSPIFLYWRQFSMSSFWMIIFWTLWNNVVGMFLFRLNVAYWAHLGGFAAGFVVTFCLCKWGWIKMERYEKSLVQIWQEWRQGSPSPEYDPVLAQAGLPSTPEESQPEPPIPLPPPELPSIPLLDLQGVIPRATKAAPILVQCSCGHTINASRRYEGKLVRCPRCQGTVRIPRRGEPANVQRPPAESPTTDESDPVDDYIRFSCRCGQAIKVPSRHAGRFGVCPQCGARLQIPQLP